MLLWEMGWRWASFPSSPGTPVHPPQLIDNLSEITCMGGSTVPEHAAWVPRTKEQQGSHRVVA
jgi:hypothetical protein